MRHPLRAGVIGLGHLGRHHARIYGELPGVRLAAVCDTDPAAIARVKETAPEAVAVAHGLDLLEQVDLVSIVTPTRSHFEAAMPFLERGVPVLLEKPIAARVEEAEALVRAAGRRRGILQVGHIEEFNPALVACRPWIEKPRFIEAHRMGSFSGRGTDVDVVLELMIHDLDLVLEWVGEEVKMVHAVGVSVLSQRFDIASVRLEFEGGAVANLTASRVSLASQRRMRLFMPRRYLRIDFLERSAECVERSLDDQGNASIQGVPIEVPPGDSLRAELQSFVDCVRTGGRPKVDGERALRALRLALGIQAQIEARA